MRGDSRQISAGGDRAGLKFGAQTGPFGALAIPRIRCGLRNAIPSIATIGLTRLEAFRSLENQCLKAAFEWSSRARVVLNNCYEHSGNVDPGSEQLAAHLQEPFGSSSGHHPLCPTMFPDSARPRKPSPHPNSHTGI
jgi:hypothetical protein